MGCTNKNFNLKNKQSVHVQKIHEFLAKHSWDKFKSQCIKILDTILNPIPTNINTGYQSPSKMEKYALRTVVDVKIKENWCPATVIQRFYDCSIKVAMHADDLDADGFYLYDRHLRIRKNE